MLLSGLLGDLTASVLGHTDVRGGAFVYFLNYKRRAEFQEIINSTLEFLWAFSIVVYETFKSMIQLVFQPKLKDVKGEVVLITGTGHGMGREMALRFARLEAIVVCVDINSSTNEDTAKMIKAEKGAVYTYQCDVTKRAAVMELADKVRRDVGDVTILVNNAGIMPSKPMLEQTEEEIRLTNDINVLGNLWMLQAFLPAMVSRNHGHIVAMSSVAGLIGSSNLVPYCGTKFAVRGIMEALAIEMRQDSRKLDGIKFTTICPFIVNTGLCKKTYNRFPKLFKFLEPDAAADLIVDAIRRNFIETTVPTDLHYVIRYLYRVLPREAATVGFEYFGVGVSRED